jgi:hypothetical protein
VEKQRTEVRISAQFTNLKSPTTFGHEYLTYVMWALTPDGRAFNIGEVVLPTTARPGRRSQPAITARSPSRRRTRRSRWRDCGAVLCREAPSRIVVLINGFAPGTEPLQKLDYQLRRRGGGRVRADRLYLRRRAAPHRACRSISSRHATPAHRAVGRGEDHAAAVFGNAVTQMRRADDLAGQKKIDKRGLSVAAREAVQTAEDARAIAERAVE